MKILAFAGCKTTTLECIQTLIEDGYKVGHLITLSPEQGERYQVSGYLDMSDFANKNGISIYNPKSYSLQKEVDEAAISGLGIDILVVIGWQRLIPEWLLKILTVGAFGMHGSAEPLPKGRGRSPVNWSLIEGQRRFLAHLIKYDTGVDSGPLVDVYEFDINPFDTCETLHFKNRIAMNRLLKKNLTALMDGTAKLKTQSADVEPTFYPKRTPGDGIIHWDNSTEVIYNLVRAVTKPFPGAFTYLCKSIIYIWRAQPFDSKILYEDSGNGEITEVFHNGNFVVKTRDGSLLITEYSGVSFENIVKGAICHDKPV